MRFESFNGDYVRRLTDGDSAAGEHFALYFGSVLFLKLRVHLRSFELIEDIRQETLLRVLLILRQRSGVRHPDRLGAFVNGVCDNVVRELRRLDERAEPWGDNHIEEPVDPRVDPDAELVNAESKRAIEQVFAVLPKRDRKILQALYLDEMNKAEVCRMFDIDAAYLRVLQHRAKLHFRRAYDRWRGCQANLPHPVNPNAEWQPPGLRRTALPPRVPPSRRS